MTDSSARLGRIGEQIAARHLARLGMTILDRNWRCHDGDLRGELDIVARSGSAVVFCEVKTRRSQTPAGPLEAVTPAKVRQLRRLAGAWLAAHPPPPAPIRPATVRIDAIAVSWPAAGGRPIVTHVQGIDG